MSKKVWLYVHPQRYNLFAEIAPFFQAFDLSVVGFFPGKHRPNWNASVRKVEGFWGSNLRVGTQQNLSRVYFPPWPSSRIFFMAENSAKNSQIGSENCFFSPKVTEIHPVFTGQQGTVNIPVLHHFHQLIGPSIGTSPRGHRIVRQSSPGIHLCLVFFARVPNGKSWKNIFSGIYNTMTQSKGDLLLKNRGRFQGSFQKTLFKFGKGY